MAKRIFIFLMVTVWIFIGWPQIIPFVDFPPKPKSASAAWLSGGWDQRIAITVSNTNIDSDVTHFPLLLTLGTSVGTGSDDVSAIFDELTSDANRLKIAVTESDGTTEIKVEIEDWDDASESAHLWVASSALTLSSSGTTTLYIYYDSDHADNTTNVGDVNSTPGRAVWDSGHEAVYHSSETTLDGTADEVKESTSNVNHGKGVGFPAPTDPSAIGGGFDYNPTDDDHLEIDDSASLSPSGSISLEAWVYLDDTYTMSTARNIIAKDTNLAYRWRVQPAGTPWLLLNDGSFEVLTGDVGHVLPVGQWVHYAVTADLTTGEVLWYADGVEVDDTTTTKTSIQDSSGVLRISTYNALIEEWNGGLDEVRISSGVRTPAWIKASYYSGDDNLVSWGSEELEADLTISSAANQSFELGQASTAISTITITDVTGGTITAANDLRIGIASTSVDMRWDSSDTTASFGGTAWTDEVTSTTVTYERGDAVMVVSVVGDFDAGETLTISGLSYSDFDTAVAPTANALGVFEGGSGDFTYEATQSETLAITTPTPTPAPEAVPGDYMIRRNDLETTTITTSVTDIDWDTLVGSRGTSITWDDEDFSLLKGKYLVAWGEQVNDSNTTNNERTYVYGKLVIAGTASTSGAGSGYMRKSSTYGQDTFLSGITIIDIASNSTTLDMQMQRLDISVGTVTRVTDVGGVSIVALDGDNNFARYHLTSSQAIGNDPSSKTVVWDVNDEQDTGFSRSTDAITITTGGRYFVSYTIDINNNSGNNRAQFSANLTVGGTDEPGTHTSCYLRGRTSTEAIFDCVLQWGGVLDLSDSDVLRLTADHLEGGTDGADMEPGSSIEIWQLPSQEESIIVRATNGEMAPATQADFAWDTVDADLDGFTHSAGNTNIDVDAADDYLFFASQFNCTDGGNRHVPWGRFTVENSLILHTIGGSYNRGSGTATDGGYAIGALLPGLSANNSVELANLSTAEDDLIANCQGQFSAIRLGSVVPPRYTQSAYRLFANDNSTDVGTALAAQDTAYTLTSDGQAFRLRSLMHITSNSLGISGTTFKLQYAEQSGSCDVSFSGETYIDVTTTTSISFNDNATPADGAALTANASDPTDGFTTNNQDYEETNNFTNSESAIGEGADGKWDFSLIDNTTSVGTAYCLRMVESDGTVLDTYEHIPQITTVSVAETITLTIDAGGSLALGTIVGGSQRITGTTRLKTEQTGGASLTITAGRLLAQANVTLASTAAPSESDSHILDVGDSPGGLDVFDGLGGSCTDGTGPATWPGSTGTSSGLGFVLWAASSAKEATCWGSGTTESDSANRYAALEASSSASSFINITSSPPATLYASIGYSLEVKNAQKSTDYQGGVVYTATVSP